MILGWRKQSPENVVEMKRQKFQGSAVEGSLIQECLYEFQNLMQCQTNDDCARLGEFSSRESSLPTFRADEGVGVSPCSYGTNMSCSGFNYSVPSNSGSSMLKLNGEYTSYFQHSSQGYRRGSTLLVDSDGNGMPSMENIKQLCGQGVSPGQILSIVTRSDADGYSDKVPLQVGTFSEPASGNYGLQALKSEHGRLQSCLPAHCEISSGTQMYGSRVKHGKLHKVPLERSSEPTQLVSERLPSFEEKRYTSAQAPRTKLTTEFLQAILRRYLKFKNKPEYLYYLHLDLCILACECEKYSSLISHFEDCHDTKCHLCQPVRQSCPIKKITPESGMHNGYVASDLHASNYIVQDMQHPPKRMKIENAAKFDDWSLFAVIRPYLEQQVGGLENDEDHIEKTNGNPLWSKKVSTTAVNCNATAHYDGGSMWSRKSGGLSGLGQSPEGHINSASLDEFSRSMRNDGNIYNIKLGNDDTVSHCEEHNSVDKQLEMDWIKTSKGGSELTFCCLSSSSENTYLLPKEGNHGKVLRTCSDALDLDNINLGKDDAVSHSEEHKLIDEPQEIGCAKIRKEESDVTFSCPNLIYDSISVLPQVEDVGESLRTSNDALDLDNLKLGKDDAISHSKERSFAGEEQEMSYEETSKVKSNVTLSYQSSNSDGISVFPQESPVQGENLKLISQAKHIMVDGKFDFANPDNHSRRKLEGLTVSGVALTDFFKAEQIREHLHSLNQHINLNVGQELHARMSADTVGSNTCQLCTLDTIMFTALARCCTCCDARIKHNSTYFWTKDGAGARYCFCTACFKGARGGNITCKGLSFPKAQLEKGKNTEESGEAWVQCDKCERWQHQICALYNSQRDLKGKAKYTCPFCRLTEIEAKGHVPITPASGAEDLPRTKLSDYIEQRLFRSLQQERKQRAEFLGKNPDEVPGALDLKVRVVLAVNKKQRVKQQFLDILHGEAYPTEFPYKSKVILLFQKVEGVDVCLFAMYVQEYGSECGKPNKRSVYISYLDSVKYFRPEIKTVAGVALRTFVYYEIIIGYLDYCKRLGFLTCYIWSCPPSKDEDYILHCHPETQKRPKPNKLVQWYKKMLKKAKEENVVVEVTNFYNRFFLPNGDSNCKITAARVPYFDGDYWSRAIDDMVQEIEKDSGGESDRQFKTQMKKRTMKAMGHNDLSTDATKDILVMQKLGHKILHVKEEFFVVHLQFTCTNCREAILSGNCWSCSQCSKFHLCGRCHELELSSNLLGTHTTKSGDTHHLHKIPVNVAAETDDKDDLLYNHLFDNRHLFLKFCEENYYRFDTLRRAKHSTMMIVYHLLESMIVKTICSICNQNVVKGWNCEICSQFHVCSSCYQSEGDGCHVHKLVKHSKEAQSRIKSEQMQQQRSSESVPRRKGEHRALELMLLDTLGHASGCSSTTTNPCLYPQCLRMRALFRHSRECERGLAGHCKLCKKTWDILQLHSKSCKGSNCKIPRCKDLKKFNLEQIGGVNNCQYQ